jgi:hypothetical protein
MSPGMRATPSHNALATRVTGTGKLASLAFPHNTDPGRAERFPSAPLDGHEPLAVMGAVGVVPGG